MVTNSGTSDATRPGTAIDEAPVPWAMADGMTTPAATTDIEANLCRMSMAHTFIQKTYR
jgi:hypothetical protein